jgi:inosine/xanthosine triphosphatase
MKVGVGGTFNVIHRGHRAVLDKAFQIGDFVVVGITSDQFASSFKKQTLPLEERISKLRTYLETKDANWSITVIDDKAGPTKDDMSIEALVVSPETLPSAQAINGLRLFEGLFPLKIVEVPHVLAEDCIPISSSRILSGEIDDEGRMLRPVRIVVGSDNQIKIDAVRDVMARIYARVEVTGVRAATNVGEQPHEEETLHGATERAKKAIGQADFGVGLEAGVFEMEYGMYDLQYCVVMDKRGHMTIGHGSGFRYPPDVAEKVRMGWSVGDSFRELYGWDKDGKKEGAISYLTNGLLRRKELAEQAVLAAMVPRIRRDLYPDL